MLPDALEQSAASAALRDAIDAWLRGDRQDRLVVHGHQPRVKVERVLEMLFRTWPERCFDRIEIAARSGCSNFTGTLHVMPQDEVIEFDWDCAWKAREVGYTMLGIPDQSRAAQEFGYDCFRRFEPRR